MKNRTRMLIVLSIMLCLTGIGHSQETSITLPTNDNTSGFNVMKNNGTSVFKVDGSGMMTGDGSGLSNVRPIVVYSNGDDGVAEVSSMSCAPEGVWPMTMKGFLFVEGCIGGLNLYEAQKMKSLTISCPGPGTIVAQASGYIAWASINEDLARIWLYPHPTVSPTDSWETPDYHNLRILSDCQCSDRSDQYTTWSISRCYNVSSAQNFTVSICADKPFTDSAFFISDIDMQLMFFPQ